MLARTPDYNATNSLDFQILHDRLSTIEAYNHQVILAYIVREDDM